MQLSAEDQKNSSEKKKEDEHLRGIIENINANEDVVLEAAKEVDVDAKHDQDANIYESADIQGRTAESQAEIYKIDLDHAKKIITEVVSAASDTIVDASKTITADILIPAATTTSAPTLHAAPSRRTNGVVIRDLEETTTSTIIHYKAKSKDKAKEDNAVKRYQAIKRKPLTKAQARKNIMIYLKNVAGFKMDYFKAKEQMDEEDSRALKRMNESQEEKAAKKQKLDDEVEELK
nr:hypothetical protein [Tanacetum cinerariifolium]